MKILAIHNFPRNNFTAYIVDKLDSIIEIENITIHLPGIPGLHKFLTEEQFRKILEKVGLPHFSCLEMLCIGNEIGKRLSVISEEDVLEVYI